MALFNRIVSLTIGTAGNVGQAVNFYSDKDQNAPHITFNIVKTNSQEPNTAMVDVYNSEKTIDSVLPKASEVTKQVLILHAGYEQDVGLQLMYVGTITNLEKHPQKPDSTVKFTANDGYEALTTKRFGKSYEKKASAKQLMKDCTDAMGAPVTGMDPKEIIDQILDGGFTASGPASNTMDTVTKKLKLRWSFQNGNIKIVPYSITNSEIVTAYFISEFTGMIGAPEMITDPDYGDGYRVKSLLLPQVEPDDVIQLDKYGSFRVHKVTHSGGTYIADFTSELLVFSK